jgi:flavin reductase (DIM6/NTAB) family NADH-FMN oxidoreductase RutF
VTAEQQLVQPEVTQQAFSATELRAALGAFATGVTVITSRGDEHAYGMTANSFTSVSLDPPLVLVCVISGTRGAETIEANRSFAINILGAHQEPVSRYFAWRERPHGERAFEEVTHSVAATGCPILEGAAAYFDCRLAATHEAGDHVIFIGEVLAMGLDDGVEPLVYHGGGYCKVRVE